MNSASSYEFRVKVWRDQDSQQIIAEVPALDLADYGADTPEALARLQDMVVFHLESLVEEGKPIPHERGDEGLFLRVRLPAHAP